MSDADARLAALAQRLARRLRARELTLATAESCTGGWLAKVLTDPPGASHWLLAGWVVYSNDSKTRELGVRVTTLARHGAVSEQTVRELARQARRRAGTDLAVAISGIAGPGGATPGKPVGTVWFGFARRSGRTITVAAVRKRFRGDRETVRRRAVEFALRRLYSSA
ncbi:MAG: nicotinamide-nucleotide amidohydrolase family protein [Gammaproteobacteria bacterium]|nr:nicotinamide-nucleotide amidohydrolase family protein [Gammaproteobacteria bacterium]